MGAWARWLAEQLEQPLIVCRASDLLSPYLGESEQKIARAFEQASHNKAVLLIDEVDSFLQDRRAAQRSCEVSQVNEMLTQMEGFNGVFIASTNLMSQLDQAALRRFDLKIRFDYLKPKQALSLFTLTCQQQGLPEPTATQQQTVHGMRHLSPRDFATVARQHRFKALPSVQDWIAALQSECTLKNEAKQHPVGFI